MSTLGFTILAAVVAVLAMLWLLIVDRPQTARVSRRFRRGTYDNAPVVATSVRTARYRRPGIFTRLKAVIGLSAMAGIIGFLVAVTVALTLAVSAFLLRRALG